MAEDCHITQSHKTNPLILVLNRFEFVELQIDIVLTADRNILFFLILKYYSFEIQKDPSSKLSTECT